MKMIKDTLRRLLLLPIIGIVNFDKDTRIL